MKTIKLLMFLGVLAMAACTKKPDEPPANKQCEHKATFEKTACGLGVYGSYWIRLEDGTLLQPCKTDVSIDESQIYDGREIEVSYEAISGEIHCIKQSTCLAWPGEHSSVKITCLKLGEDKRETAQCEHLGVLRNWSGKLDGCGWVIEKNDGAILEIQEEDTKGFDDGTPVQFGYKNSARMSVCMAGETVDITCMNVALTTQTR